MPATHEVRVYDQSGTLVVLNVDFRRVEWSIRLDRTAHFQFTIRDDDPDVLQFLQPTGKPIKDLLFELYRADLTTDPSRPLAQYLEFAGFTRYGQRAVEADADQLFESRGPSYTDLLRRGRIAYNTDEARSTQTGPAETVMKNFVLQNLGAAALAAQGRDRDHVIPNLSIEADAATGSTWDGQRSRRNLLEVCQEVGTATDTRFRVVADPVARPGFIFQAHASPIGLDRTTIGLDASTGLNGAGNRPVIFSFANDNMAEPLYFLDARGEVTAVIVAGEGEGAAREVAIRTNVGTIGDSPWNDIEGYRDARDVALTAELNTRGDEELQDRAEIESFEFGVLQVPSTIYGLDYLVGDQVTAVFGDRVVHYDITGMDGIVNESNIPREQITLEVQERP